ncbi:kinesin-like protein KIN-14Q [Heracleum sosnowskyi]|uniref:Kinesin-like protein KIN-14Q n=1 Tax=Heracleum sosnowskyi TaxID=360622 RepID=A0AAD8GSP3_9APIA|nr:kinesin-like protein KIN-14Q [Heracleum sosnowskyi]
MEDDDQWLDPLLITDASCQQNHNLVNKVTSLEGSRMEDVDESYSNISPGPSMLRFSLSAPDLVVCEDSPVFRGGGNQDSLENLMEASTEVSLENGINGSEMEHNPESLSAKMISNEDGYTESSFELLPQPASEENLFEGAIPIISINSGSADSSVICGGTKFLEDNCFDGGDTTIADATVGDEKDFSLYRTARLGNFSYYFRTLESGVYMVDLHFAEIVFTEGPSMMRVFDIFIQEEKVIYCLDVFARVGANSPLVIPGLKTFVKGDEGLTIRFEGIIGSPIVCGISIRKSSSAYTGEFELLTQMRISQIAHCVPPKCYEDYKVEGSLLDSLFEYECQDINPITDSEEVLKRMGTSPIAHCVPPKCYEKYEVDGSLLPSISEYECQDFNPVTEREEAIKQKGISLIAHCAPSKCFEDYKMEGSLLNSISEYECQETKLNECQKNELIETKRMLEVLRRENEQKSKECQNALNSLHELQNELMRKSMHVGSLAFAVEGQVKEKSRWFSSLRDLTRKLKILKMEQIKLAEEALSYKMCVEDMNEVNSIIMSKFKDQVELHKDLKVKYVKGAKERKELYNKILELKGNIRVFCRCRPLNSEEIADGAMMAIDFGTDSELAVKSNGALRKSFKFDAVFGPQADQVDVFEDTAPFATSVLDGYNIRDLLAPGSHSGVAAKRLEIRQVGEGIHHVPGLVEASVKNMSEVWEVLQTGSNARAVGSTNANEHSSRSHCIHCVMVKGENMLNGERTRSKLWLVDLAGSERVAKTEVQGERLKETQNINRSLSALGDVISSLATKSPHIPFRNSKLTHLLQDSLGGDSKTLMLVQISPNENDLSETLCSLNFASRVRGIELGPARKQFDSTELIKYKQLVEKTKQEMKVKEVQAKKMEDTIHGFDMKMKEKDLKNKNLQDKIKELESQLLVERKLARQHVDTKIAEQQQQNRHLEETNHVIRSPGATRTLGIQKYSNEGKDQVHPTRPLTENSNYKYTAATTNLDGSCKYNDSIEKENNPDTAEQFPLPKRTGRASICTVQRIPASSAPRRNSLIPLPGSAKVPPPVRALSPIHSINEEDKDRVEPKCMPEGEIGSRKLANILRRSVQKKMQLKSPKQQQARRGGGLNVGMEKVRVSIGSRGRLMAHRVLHGNGRRAAKDPQQKQQGHREKERGWNTGTAVRAVI